MDPEGGWGDAYPQPDPRLLKGMPKIHAHFDENESKMSKIARYPLPPEISGSTPGKTCKYSKYGYCVKLTSTVSKNYPFQAGSSSAIAWARI